MSETFADFDSSPVSPDRIAFPGSPWPDGHAIIEFCWSARIEAASGLWFDLHLQSADYYAEDQDEEVEEDESLPNWESKVVWSNYHACTLSSTCWDNGGFKVTSGETPFEFDALDGREFVVDPLPRSADNSPAFGIYLQGHDSAADHRITFKRLEGKNGWSIAWRGRVALTYRGDNRFIHQFKALVKKTGFDGIFLPSKTTKKQAKSLLARYVARPEQFELETVDGRSRFKLS